MAIEFADYRCRVLRRLAALSGRHRAAFAALCAERQYGTYAYVSRLDSSLRPDVLRKAIDRCWAFIRGEEISSDEWADLNEAINQLIPNLDVEYMSGYASLILDATAAVSYLLNTCITGSPQEAVFAGECARNAVDEWVTGIVAPKKEGLPEHIISISPGELPALQALIDSHPIVVREMQQEEHDLTYLENHKTLTADDCDHLRNAWPNRGKSNLDLE
jgi:hypothetical protein